MKELLFAIRMFRVLYSSQTVFFFCYTSFCVYIYDGQKIIIDAHQYERIPPDVILLFAIKNQAVSIQVEVDLL